LIRDIFLYLLLGLIVFMAGAGYYFGLTTQGLQTSLAIAANHIPGKLTIGQVHGNLLTNFSLKNIHYEDAQQSTTVKSFSLEWQPLGLLASKVIIDNLIIDDAKTILLNSTSPNQPATANQTFAMPAFHKWLEHFIIQEVHINHFTLQKDKALINFTGAFDHHWHIAWDVNLPTLTDFVPTATGTIISHGTVIGLLAQPTINAELNITNLAVSNYQVAKLNSKVNIIIKPATNSVLTLRADNIKIDKTKLKHLDLTLTASIAQVQKVLITNFNILLAKKYHINGQIRLPKFTTLGDLNQPIAGDAQTQLANLSLLSTYVPLLQNPRGLATAHITLAGNINKPLITSSITLTNGAVKLPLFGTNISQITLNSNLDLARLLQFNGNFTIGHGTGKLTGTLNLAQPNYPLQLTVSGNDLALINLPEYKINATPNLQLNMQNNILQLTGTILVPSAKIVPVNFTNTVTLPSEIVYVNKPLIQSAPLIKTNLQLTITLGKKVHISYQHLETDLEGTININQSANRPATATGSLNTINGHYAAYGQSLSIGTGRLSYTGGSLLNPGLHIEAFKKVRAVVTASLNNNFTNQLAGQSIYEGTQNIKLGVRVEGTLTKPLITLFADPGDLSQADILSYLILGYPQSQASGQQSAAILSALAAMNPQAGTFTNITQQLQKTLGVNELNVESVQTFDPNNTNPLSNTTSLVVGKQLTEKVYLRYSIGLFNPISILNLRYQLTPRWALQSETSSIDNGADFLYGFERD
jgi:autotransporter translocation and assembly factor TamB